MYQNIRQKGFVAPVDVLMDIGVLSKKDYEDWHFGRVPFLEKICHANLHQLSGMMHEMRAYAAQNSLKPSWTFYHQYRQNRKNKLRFSKYGNEKIEAHYATHFVEVKHQKP